MSEPSIASEDDIIQRYLAPLAADFAGAHGLLDDCATLSPPPGHDLVVTTDALVEGVHFLPGEKADAVAWKALAVNVSDLVGKGARPLAYLMALALPSAPEVAWMRAFAGGLGHAQQAFGLHLAGGDTDRTPGHLSVSITAFGIVPAGRTVRRSGARPGDRIYVSGPIGDATLGLRLARDPFLAATWGLDAAGAAALLDRFRRPVPRVAVAGAVLEHASASMDVSDGLAKDLARLCRASGCRAVVKIDDVAISAAARQVVTVGGASEAELITGGEDYEVLCTVPAARARAFEAAARKAGVTCARIGEMQAGEELVLVGRDGQPLSLNRSGWDHF